MRLSADAVTIIKVKVTSGEIILVLIGHVICLMEMHGPFIKIILVQLSVSNGADYG